MGHSIFDLYHKFSISECSLTMSLILCAFPKKVLILFALWQDVCDFFITKSMSYRWNQKTIRDFNVHVYIDCWANGCLLSWSFKRHTTPYHKWLGKFTCFLQAVIFIFHLNGSRQKFQHHHLSQCRLLIQHWRCCFILAYCNPIFVYLFPIS